MVSRSTTRYAQMDARSRVFVALFALVLVMSSLVPRRAFATKVGNNFYSTSAAATVYVDMMLQAGYGKYIESKEGAGGSGPSSDVTGEPVVNAGNMSAAAGFPDLEALSTETAGPNDEETWNTFFGAVQSKNSYSYSFDGYAGGSPAENAIQDYGRYGYALRSLGLDQTTATNVSNPLRSVMGLSLNVFYTIARSSEDIMRWCMNALQALNPFGIFKNFGAGDPSNVNFSRWEGSTGDPNATLSGDVTGENGVYSGGTFFGSSAVKPFIDVYNTFYTFARDVSVLTILPVSAVIAVILILMNKLNLFTSMDGQKKVRRYLVRTAFVVAGIPLLGALYTGFLDSSVAYFEDEFGFTAASASSNGFTTSADGLLLSEFVDFRGWAQNSNLAVDSSNMTIGYKDGSVSGDSYAKLRGTTFTINKNWGMLGSKHVELKDDISKESKDGLISSMKNLDQVTGSSSAARAAALASLSPADTQAYVRELINDFSTGVTYDASSYESYIKGSIGERDVDPKNGVVSGMERLAEWLKITADPESYASGLLDGVAGGSRQDAKIQSNCLLTTSTAPTRTVSLPNEDADKLFKDLVGKARNAAEGSAERAALEEQIKKLLEDEAKAAAATTTDTKDDGKIAINGRLFGNGSLDYSGATAYADGTFSSGTPTYSGDHLNAGQKRDNFGLCDIGMYNYLNSEFSDNGFQVYSGAKSANTQSRVGHYAVNFVGNGILGFALWFNTVALLAAVGITGFVFGLSMLVNNAKRAFSFLITLPSAMLTSLTAIARVLMLVLAMAAEVIVGVFTYELGRTLLYAIDSMVVGITTGGAATSAASSSVTSSAIPGALTQGYESMVGVTGASGLFSVEAAQGTSLGAFVIGLLLAGLLYILYLIMILKLRKAITAAIDDAISGVIARLTGARATDIPASNALGNFGKAAVAGTLMNPGGAGRVAGALTGAAAGAGIAGAAAGGFGNGNSEALLTDNGVSNSNAGDGTVYDDSSSSATEGDSSNRNGFLEGGSIENSNRQLEGARARGGTLAGDVDVDAMGDGDTTYANSSAEGDAFSTAAGDSSWFNQADQLMGRDGSINADIQSASIGQADMYGGNSEINGADANANAEAFSEGGTGGDGRGFGEGGDGADGALPLSQQAMAQQARMSDGSGGAGMYGDLSAAAEAGAQAGAHAVGGNGIGGNGLGGDADARASVDPNQMAAIANATSNSDSSSDSISNAMSDSEAAAMQAALDKQNAMHPGSVTAEFEGQHQEMIPRVDVNGEVQPNAPMNFTAQDGADGEGGRGGASGKGGEGGIGKSGTVEDHVAADGQNAGLIDFGYGESSAVVSGNMVSPNAPEVMVGGSQLGGVNVASYGDGSAPHVDSVNAGGMTGMPGMQRTMQGAPGGRGGSGGMGVAGSGTGSVSRGPSAAGDSSVGILPGEGGHGVEYGSDFKGDGKGSEYQRAVAPQADDGPTGTYVGAGDVTFDSSSNVGSVGEVSPSSSLGGTVTSSGSRGKPKSVKASQSRRSSLGYSANAAKQAHKRVR